MCADEKGDDLVMSHLITFNGHGTFSPDGKVDLTPQEAEEHNRAQDANELAVLGHETGTIRAHLLHLYIRTESSR